MAERTTRSRAKANTPAPPALTTTRTTRARTKPSTQPSPEPTVAPIKKTASRKPLLNRENATKTTGIKTSSAKKTVSPKAASAAVSVAPANDDHEAITAYLRIRPYIGNDEPSSTPYLITLSDTTVRMTDDQQSNRSRMSTLPPSSVYKFSHVFPPDTKQSDFFTKSTLPLVHDALQGQSGLLFAYGATNAGKTYTVQGGTQEGTAGILPRTLDVIFNSIEGLHGDGKYRPVRLQGVEPATAADSKAPPVTPAPAVAAVLDQEGFDSSALDNDIDPTVLKLDRNYEYTIWLSYAEVYNEKIYDLLDSVEDQDTPKGKGVIPRSGSDKTLRITRKALAIRPSPPSDGIDSTVRGKYISGLSQFRVHSASQAKALVKLGQIHRRVFGTLANSESSRSHGMVIIKVMKVHRGEKNDPTAAQISRLTLVDLAGSERTKHTHTTGDRLKEAGNINKSLMVLGQCMEVMRSNQRKLAMSLSHDGIGKDGRMDTRDVKRTLSVVPFRHSKLTESLMDYFIGDGKVVMIVNVNPYDTGYDENSHVMKFAALAREVFTMPAPAPLQQLPQGAVVKASSKMAQLGNGPKPFTRKVTISLGGPGTGKKGKDAVLEVFEEDETDTGNGDEEEDDDNPINPLVDELFDEVEDLRMQLFEAEMRCAMIEVKTREEVIHEMEERMRQMDRRHTMRLRQELEQNEQKTDAKIDLLYQSGLFGSPVKKGRAPPSDEDEVEDDNSSNSEGETFDFGNEGDSDEDEELSSNESRSASPLAGKERKNKRQSTLPPGGVREIREMTSDGPMLPSDTEDAESTETDSATTSVTGSDSEGEEDPENESESEVSDGDQDWVPPEMQKTPKAKGKARAARAAVTKLERQVATMSLGDIGDSSMVVIPLNKPRGSNGQKKQMRQLGKKSVVTEEQIERMLAMESCPSGGKTIKRLL